MHIEEQLNNYSHDEKQRSKLFDRAVSVLTNTQVARIPEWEKPQNKAAIAFLNSRSTLEQRLAKFREEALEAALEVTRELDHPEQLAQAGLRGDTLAEIADVVVTLDSLISRTGDNVHLLAAITRAYARLRGRIVAGEFGTPPET